MIICEIGRHTIGVPTQSILLTERPFPVVLFVLGAKSQMAFTVVITALVKRFGVRPAA
jgi:hypothetical protein